MKRWFNWAWCVVLFPFFVVFTGCDKLPGQLQELLGIKPRVGNIEFYSNGGSGPATSANNQEYRVTNTYFASYSSIENYIFIKKIELQKSGADWMTIFESADPLKVQVIQDQQIQWPISVQIDAGSYSGVRVIQSNRVIFCKFRWWDPPEKQYELDITSAPPNSGWKSEITSITPDEHVRTFASDNNLLTAFNVESDEKIWLVFDVAIFMYEHFDEPVGNLEISYFPRIIKQ